MKTNEKNTIFMFLLALALGAGMVWIWPGGREDSNITAETAQHSDEEGDNKEAEQLYMCPMMCIDPRP